MDTSYTSSFYEDEEQSSPFATPITCFHCASTPCLLLELKFIIDEYAKKVVMEGDLFQKQNSSEFVPFEQLSNNQKRFLLYKKCVKHKYGYLSKGERINLGCCVEEYIRNMYPSETFTGFKEGKKKNDHE